MKAYNKAPLPFQGQKRNFVKKFKQVLRSYPDNAIFVDLFGGSGLLSHIVKQEKSKAKVVYNDYDDFIKRLEAIPTTNEIIKKLKPVIKGIDNKSKIPPLIKNKALKIIKTYDRKGYVDYISLSANLLFSMNYAKNFHELKKQTFYNRLRKSDYSAMNYLKGVTFDKGDYKTIFEKYKNYPNVVFLVDPPYLSTSSVSYNNYWKLSDYLDVIKVLTGTKYFYFTSSKSNIVELCKWIENNLGGINPFNKAKAVYNYNSVGNNIGYNEIILYKGFNTSKTF